MQVPVTVSAVLNTGIVRLLRFNLLARNIRRKFGGRVVRLVRRWALEHTQTLTTVEQTALAVDDSLHASGKLNAKGWIMRMACAPLPTGRRDLASLCELCVSVARSA